MPRGMYTRAVTLSSHYGAVHRTAPTYSTLTLRSTVVSATHIAELRTALQAVW